MTKKLGLVLGGMILLLGCTQSSPEIQIEQKLRVNGHWVTEANGQTMLNPQTSGLVKWREGLLTLSDRSADPSQRLRLRPIAPQTSLLQGPDLLMVPTEQLQQSCFANYATGNPDLEALAVDPDNDNVVYIVTEDASYADPMSEECQQRYLNSGSTQFPTLLIRLEIQSNNIASMTHVRPIKFASSMEIGDFPNDGIEALAFGKQRTLYLGLEKDSQNQARIFSLQMDNDFWQSTDFALVSDTKVKLPVFDSGNHPINGMDYYQNKDNREFLLVAARNDESLWVVDLQGEKETRIIYFDFYAEVKQNTQECSNYEAMFNASIEGVAVIDNTLWLINDPWKAMYLKNINCPQNRTSYEMYAPLLFSLPIQAKWFD